MISYPWISSVECGIPSECTIMDEIEESEKEKCICSEGTLYTRVSSAHGVTLKGILVNNDLWIIPFWKLQTLQYGELAKEFCFSENDLHSIKIFGAWKWTLLDLITEFSRS